MPGSNREGLRGAALRSRLQTRKRLRRRKKKGNHKKILIYGFEPFAQRKANVAGDIADAFDGLKIGGLEIRSVRLSVKWGAPLEELKNAIKKIKDEGQTVFAVFGLGETDEKKPKLERQANNERGAAPDNEGKAPKGKTVKGGPDTYESPLFDDIKKCLKKDGVDFKESDDAGRYLCEESFYAAMHLMSTKKGEAGNAGFFHLPKYPNSDKDGQDDKNKAHMRDLKRIVQKILECIAALDP